MQAPLPAVAKSIQLQKRVYLFFRGGGDEAEGESILSTAWGPTGGSMAGP